MALWAATSGSAEGQAIWEAFSARAAKNSEQRTIDRWRHYANSPPTSIGAGTIFYRAQLAQPGWRLPSDAAPEHSDEALTVRFVFEREADLRYTAHWNRWHHWTGSYWREDRTLVSLNLSRQFCRRIARAANKGGRSLASARTVNAVVGLARADQRIAATVDQWDADPWLLGTPGGTVDLHRGVLLANGAENYITRVAAVTPEGECPIWINTIQEIANNKQDIVDYFQRIAGYLLTGSVREEKMFFLYGLGGNGKGTFIETLAYVLGAYSTTVAMSTLVMTKHSEHPTEIAKLCGTRLALASETNEAARWNSARIKLLTGGDALTGRFMRGDYFDFPPTHKLIVSSNRRPLLGRVDEAIVRRTVMIPFERTFTTPDRTLKDRLRTEAAGILSWAVEGCLIWQRWGLRAPASVEVATQEYLRDQDDIQLFIDEHCVEDSAARTSSTALYGAWQDYCRTAGVHPGSKKDFTQRMMAKYPHRLIQNLTNFEGVRLMDLNRDARDPDPSLFDAPS
jgi:putative DNA primase/helicase